VVETEHQSLNLIIFGSLWSVLHYKLALIGLIHTLQVSKVPLIGHAIDGSSNHTLWQGKGQMACRCGLLLESVRTLFAR
jgi:hypothetical protein